MYSASYFPAQNSELAALSWRLSNTMVPSADVGGSEKAPAGRWKKGSRCDSCSGTARILGVLNRAFFVDFIYELDSLHSCQRGIN
jgi:hypothetical protein